MTAIVLPFGAGAPRRIPTLDELTNGYPCGPLDVQLDNWLEWWMSGQLANVMTAASIPVDDTDLNSLMKAVRSNNMIYKQVTGTANALIATFASALTSYANMRILIAVATQANTRSAVTININGLGARSIVRRNGVPLRRGDIQPGPILLIDNGAQYELFTSGGGASRTLLQSNLTLYVATTGSNGNDGLDPTAAFQTIQRAWSELVNNYDLNGFDATIQLANGTYTAGLLATSAPLGGNSGSGSVVILGDIAAPSNVLVATSASNAFLAQGGAQFTIRGVKIQTAGANNNCVISNPGGLITLDGVEFGGCGASHMNALGGYISSTANYAIAGGAVNHARAASFGLVSVAGKTITISAAPTFTGAFASSQQGRVEMIGNTYAGGAATGVRYAATENGVVTSSGGGATVLPGSLAGTVASGGQYV